MIRLVVIHEIPSDPARFDEHYEKVHLPIVRGFPGVRNVRCGHAFSTPEWPTNVHYMCEAEFDSLEDLRAALESRSADLAYSDIQQISDEGIMVFCAQFTDHPPLHEA